MCSGKSRIGRELAAMMDLRHIDIDRVIEQRIGPILPWVQKNGEETFRVIERTVLRELLDYEKAVISAGGGTPCDGDNMERMLAAGTVVYLDVPFDLLVQRCEQKGGDRPLLSGLKGDALRQRMEELLNARLPFYTRAQMRIRANEDAHVIAARIMQAVEGQDR